MRGENAGCAVAEEVVVVVVVVRGDREEDGLLLAALAGVVATLDLEDAVGLMRRPEAEDDEDASGIAREKVEGGDLTGLEDAPPAAAGFLVGVRVARSEDDVRLTLEVVPDVAEATDCARSRDVADCVVIFVVRKGVEGVEVGATGDEPAASDA